MRRAGIDLSTPPHNFFGKSEKFVDFEKVCISLFVLVDVNIVVGKKVRLIVFGLLFG